MHMRTRILNQQAKIVSLPQIQQMHEHISQKLALLSQLNSQFREKQQNHFLQTFAHVMDKMSEDLLLARQAYSNIDFEVEKDEKCIEIASQLKFFRDQANKYRLSFKKAQQKLKNNQQQMIALEKDNLVLKAILKKKAQEIMRLKNIVLKLKNNLVQQKEYGQANPEEISHRKSYLCANNRSINFSKDSKRIIKRNNQQDRRFFRQFKISLNECDKTLKKVNNNLMSEQKDAPIDNRISKSLRFKSQRKHL